MCDWASDGPDRDLPAAHVFEAHRHGLGYESLCKEVSDSLSWRRFCRIGLHKGPPHPTTLVKLTRRFGPGVVEDLNRVLLERAGEGKLLRGRRLRIDTTSFSTSERLCCST